MSSGFVSAGTTEDPVEKDDEWVKAQQEIEANRRAKLEPGKQEGGKTLYEVLQANKAAKQEAFEESTRLKNQFRSLDEDEVEFLDAVLESTRAQEAAVRKETSEQLDHFRKQQEEVEKSNAPQGNDGSPEVEEEQWGTRGKKRRKSHGKEALIGVKLRKTSSAGEATEKNPSITKESREADTAPTMASEPRPAAASNVKAIPQAQTAQALPKASNETKHSKSPPGKGLGLAAYSSDDDVD